MTSSIESLGLQPLSQGHLHTDRPFSPAEHVNSYITAEEVAGMLHLKTKAAQRLLNTGAIRTAFIGRRFLTTRAAVAAYLESRAEGGPGSAE